MTDLVSDAARRVRLGLFASLPDVQPLSLAGSVWGWVAAAGGVAAIALVMALEGQSSGFVSLGSLLFVPVLAAAWFLGDREAATVSALAISARLIGYAIAGVDLATAVAEVTALGVLAFMTRLAAVNVVEARERAVKMERDRRALELLEEREQMARRVTDTAIRGIFGMTLRLQALSTGLDDDGQKTAVRKVIADADAIAVDFRNVIFKGERSNSRD